APADFDTKLADLLLLGLRHRQAGDGLDCWVILDQLGVQQLSTTSTHAIEQQRLELRPARIERSGHARRSGADDNDIPLIRRNRAVRRHSMISPVRSIRMALATAGPRPGFPQRRGFTMFSAG